MDAIYGAKGKKTIGMTFKSQTKSGLAMPTLREMESETTWRRVGPVGGWVEVGLVITRVLTECRVNNRIAPMI